MSTLKTATKVFLLLFTVILGLIGALWTAIGVIFAWASNLISSFSQSLPINSLGGLISAIYGVIGYVTLAFGIFVIIVTIFGCVAGGKGSRPLLIPYSVCTFIIMGLLIALTVFVGLFVVAISSGLTKEAFMQNEDEFRNRLNVVQRWSSCCGIDGPSDYTTPIPSTCCPLEENPCTLANSYQTGCGQYNNQILPFIWPYFGTLVGFSCVGFLVFVLAVCLCGLSGRKDYDY